MPAPNKALKTWLSAASPDQRKALALEARTSVAQLQHIAHGRRQASAALAQRLVHASFMVKTNDGMAPPRLEQTELCVACSKCPIAQRMADLES
jgi:hypothetical protein